MRIFQTRFLSDIDRSSTGTVFHVTLHKKLYQFVQKKHQSQKIEFDRYASIAKN